MSNIATRQQRMAAMNLAGVWRGPLVVASETGFNAGNRAAALYLYSGIANPPITALMVSVEVLPYMSDADALSYGGAFVVGPGSADADAMPYSVELDAEPLQ